MYVLFEALGLGQAEPPLPLLSLDTAARDRVLVAAEPLLVAG
jgi:hypothetical protein